MYTNYYCYHITIMFMQTVSTMKIESNKILKHQKTPLILALELQPSMYLEEMLTLLDWAVFCTK